MWIKIKSLLIVMACICQAWTPAWSHAALPAKEEAVEILVQQIKQVIEKREQKLEIIVGNIQAPPRMQSFSAAGFKQMIVTEMQQQKFDLKASNQKAAFQLTASFSVLNTLENDKSQMQAAVKIKATLMDSTDKEIQDFSITITGNDLLPFVTNNKEFSPKVDEQERQEFILQSLLGNGNEQPQVYTSSTTNEVRTSKENPYAAKVHVLKEGQVIKAGEEINLENFVPVVPKIQQGNAHLELPERNYIVELINNSDYEAVAEVYIDTINMFAFAEDKNKTGRVMIPAHSSVFVKGWYRNINESNSFIIGSYSDSAAGKLHVPEFKVGNIKVIFSASWEKTPPPDEVISKTRNPQSSHAVGTKVGESVSSPYKQVTRSIGKPRAIINFNYDLPEHLQVKPQVSGTNTGGEGNGGGLGNNTSISFGNGGKNAAD